MKGPLDRVRTAESGPNCIEIGLVNNMPDAALQATERQFRALLSAASGELPVRLSLFVLPEVTHAQEIRRLCIDRFYLKIGHLWNRRLDGLIVTGTEPSASNLADEPYWGSLARLVDWADSNTHSSVWSCLAAHAALKKIDGIERRTLSSKLCGIFECTRAMGDPLTASMPADVRVPHSRWNDIPEETLSACGYRVLTRSARAGADTFVKRRRSQFVFFQGHPEYDADSLLLEYRRDIRRFLRGDRDAYPEMPQGCFDADAEALLRAAEGRARGGRRMEVLQEITPALLTAKVANTWRPAAVSFYRNWLLYLQAQKDQRRRNRSVHMDFDAAGLGTPPPLLDAGSRTLGGNGAL